MKQWMTRRCRERIFVPYWIRVCFKKQESVRFMSRKLSRGKRPPTTRLNDTVNQLPDGEYEDVIDLLGLGSKLPKWLELIVWQRGKQPYPSAEEKVQFEGYDLNSLRVIALRKLDAAIAELRSGLPADLEAIDSDCDNTARDTLLQTLKTIQVTKTQAIRRCYLERLVKLLGLESRIIQLVYSGEERAASLQVCEGEMRQAQSNLVLAPQIVYYRAEYLDKVITLRTKTGALDQERIRGYLDSDFAKLNVTAYPPLLMSEKLLLDEVFHALDGDGGAACRIAEYVWELDQKAPFLSPMRRAMLMVRLNDYYIVFRDREKGEQLINQFAAFDHESPQNRTIYLIRFLVVLLDWATETDGYVSLGNALEIFERNADFVIDSPVGGYRSRILIAMMAIYLGRHKPQKAKALFDHLYREKDQKPPLYYRICGMISHLMILFDLKEVADLKKAAKNYREFMVEKGEIAIPAIAFLGFLQINARRYATHKPSEKVARAYKADLFVIIERMKRFQTSDSQANVLFYGPILSWLKEKDN